MYYNTAHLQREDLNRRWAQAKRQEDLVFLIMQKFEYLTASEVLAKYVRCTHHGKSLANTPITSIRRALNSLAKEGKVVKTFNTKVSDVGHGHPEHIYLIATKHKL